MSNEEKLVECEVCHKKMKESRTLICQHSFCESCLTDDAKNWNNDTCPSCSAKCGEAGGNKEHLPSAWGICSVCEKEEIGWFCQECDQYLCSTCSTNHIKLFKDHKVIQYKKEGQSKDRFYCVNCEKIFELDCLELDSHNNHEVKNEIELIKETVMKWKYEIEKIKSHEVYQKNHFRTGEEKWMDKKNEILNYKEKVKCNYQELMDVLKAKEALEYERIDADLSTMQKDFLEHQGKIEEDILSLQEARSKIESKLEEIKKGLPEGFKDECPYELPQMHPHPSLKHHLSFQPIPKEALSQLQSCIFKPEIDFNGIYVAEEERFLKTEYKLDWYQLDEKYLYVSAYTVESISIYSIETCKLIKTLKKDKMIEFDGIHVFNTKERFYVIARCSYTNTLLTFDEEAVQLDKFTLPSKLGSFSNGEAGKVLITCEQNHVLSYDPVTKEIDLFPILSGVDDILKCCSIGGGEYCMYVRIKEKSKLVKVVKGNIVKVFDMSGSFYYPYIKLNGSGIVCIVEDGKNMRILDRYFHLIFNVELSLRGSFIQVRMDDASNIHVMSRDDVSGAYYIMKYKMIPK